MRDWLVVLRDRSDLDAVRAIVPVKWDSKYSRVVAIQATEAQVMLIRELSGVVSVSEPQAGMFMPVG